MIQIFITAFAVVHMEPQGTLVGPSVPYVYYHTPYPASYQVPTAYPVIGVPLVYNAQFTFGAEMCMLVIKSKLLKFL